MLNAGCPLNRTYGISFLASLDSVGDESRSLLLKLCHKRCHDPRFFCLVLPLLGGRLRRGRGAGAVCREAAGRGAPHALGESAGHLPPLGISAPGVGDPVRKRYLWAAPQLAQRHRRLARAIISKRKNITVHCPGAEPLGCFLGPLGPNLHAL